MRTISWRRAAAILGLALCIRDVSGASSNPNPAPTLFPFPPMSNPTRAPNPVPSSPPMSNPTRAPKKSSDDDEKCDGAQCGACCCANGVCVNGACLNGYPCDGTTPTPASISCAGGNRCSIITNGKNIQCCCTGGGTCDIYNGGVRCSDGSPCVSPAPTPAPGSANPASGPASHPIIVGLLVTVIVLLLCFAAVYMYRRHMRQKRQSGDLGVALLGDKRGGDVELKPFTNPGVEAGGATAEVKNPAMPHTSMSHTSMPHTSTGVQEVKNPAGSGLSNNLTVEVASRYVHVPAVAKNNGQPAMTYRLLDGVDINIRCEPDNRSALTGSKLPSGASFQVAECLDVPDGGANGGNQTWLRLTSGGWVFQYHPTKGTLLAYPVHVVDETMSDTPQIPFRELQAATSGFNQANCIGKGCSCAVYKAELVLDLEPSSPRSSVGSDSGSGSGSGSSSGSVPSRVLCAIKVFSPHSTWSAWQAKQFLTECDVLARVQHPNLVRLHACSTDGPQKCFVLECMDCSLDMRLVAADKPPLGWQQRMQIAVSSCRAVVHLHSLSPKPLIHRDIKSQNVLLNGFVMDKLDAPGRSIAKVADFGTVREDTRDGVYNSWGMKSSAKTHASTNQVVGTKPYMAPEYMLKGHVSERTDAFSFGILLIELLISEHYRLDGHSEQMDVHPDTFPLEARALIDDENDDQARADAIAAKSYLLANTSCCWASSDEAKQAARALIDVAVKCVKGATRRSTPAQVLPELESSAQAACGAAAY